MRRKEEAERNEEGMFCGTIALAQTQSFFQKIILLTGNRAQIQQGYLWQYSLLQIYTQHHVWDIFTLKKSPLLI